MMDDRKSQNSRLLTYLREHRTITSLEALQRLGIYRCASRVYDLRADGYEIDTTMIPTKPDKLGNVTKIAEYYLKRKYRKAA